MTDNLIKIGFVVYDNNQQCCIYDSRNLNYKVDVIMRNKKLYYEVGDINNIFFKVFGFMLSKDKYPKSNQLIQSIRMSWDYEESITYYYSQNAVLDLLREYKEAKETINDPKNKNKIDYITKFLLDKELKNMIIKSGLKNLNINTPL